MELFGFKIERTKKVPDPQQAFTPPVTDDGTTVVSAGGFFGQYLDMEGTAKSEADLIQRYREVSLHPECDMAVEDIVNEAVVADESVKSVKINVDNIDFSDDVRLKIHDEFNEVLNLLAFNTKGHDIFRRWYVDGRLYYHKVIDRKSPRKGLTEIRYIDPMKIKKVREIQKNRQASAKGIDIIEDYEEYYIFNPKGIDNTNATGARVSVDAITYCPSGIIDQSRNIVLSYLHKAIKPVNQLRMIEDAVVIYRIARAPERRIFKIDVGNLPKQKAEAYLKDVMNRYRNKLVYDASTGEIRDDRNYMSMLEDFWLPSREGGRGTDITTLPGGNNLGEIADIEYFQRKLYRSLNVPVSRLEASSGFALGRAAEITRDELKFTKFVQRLRKKFTELFNDLLKTQLILKGVITLDDWDKMVDFINYDFLKDGHFAELKESEMLSERLRLCQEVREYVGKYFSVDYVRRNILKQSTIDIKEQDVKIKKEIEDGIISGPQSGDDISSGKY